MSVLSDLDAGRRTAGFTFRLRGQVHTAPDPRDMPFQEILEALYLGGIPPVRRAMTWRQRDHLLQQWMAHYDIPPLEDCQRLLYLVDHYRDHLEYDLWTHCGADLGELFRERRWRFLLNLITHLPRHSHYSEAVSQDPEHTKLLAQAMAERGESGETEKTGPPLHTWTPEVAAMHDVLDAVRRIPWAIFMAQGGKKAAGDPPGPVPRPVTALDREIKRARNDDRQARHNALAARMLPHKRPKPE